MTQAQTIQRRLQIQGKCHVSTCLTTAPSMRTRSILHLVGNAFCVHRCTAILDTVTNPATSDVGTDGAPESDHPMLKLQLKWNGNRPNAATRSTLGTQWYYIEPKDPAVCPFCVAQNVSGPISDFERKYRRVVNEDNHTSWCRVNRYDGSNKGSSYPRFYMIRQLGNHYNNQDQDSCAELCDSYSNNKCHAMALRYCNTNQDECGTNKRCYLYSNDQSGEWPGYTITAHSSASSPLPSVRCWARREPIGVPASYLEQVHLLPASEYPSPSFEYNQEYTFQIKPWNDGPFGWNPTTNTDVTCAPVPFRPAAPTNVSVALLLDRYATIRWNAPDNDHGSTVTQYMYQICQTSTSYPTNCVGTDLLAPLYTESSRVSTTYSQSRYMCGANTSRNSLCSTGDAALAGSVFTIDGWTTSQTYDPDSVGYTYGLQPGYNYALVIRARNSYGLGWASHRLAFRMPSRISSPQYTSTPTSITATWSEYTAPTENLVGAPVDGFPTVAYQLRLSSGSGNGGRQIATTISQTDSTARSYTFENGVNGMSNLVPGDAYKLELRAAIHYDSGTRWTGWSSIANVATADDVPVTPSILMVSQRRTRSLYITVTAPFNNGATVTQFKITLTGGPVPITSTFSCYSSCTSSYSYWVNSLTPGTQYTAIVAAKNSEGYSPPSPPMNTSTCDEEPDQMAKPTMLRNSDSSITMQWVPPITDNGQPITQYRLTLYSSDSSKPCNGCTFATSPSSTPPNSLEVIDLTPGVQYQFRVQAFNGVRRSINAYCSSNSADGWSPHSSLSATFTTLVTPPETPSPVNLDEAQGRLLKLSWSAPYDNGNSLKGEHDLFPSIAE